MSPRSLSTTPALHVVTNDIRLTIRTNNVSDTKALFADSKTFDSTTLTEVNAFFNIHVRFTLLITRLLLLVLARAGGNALILSSGSHACVETPYMAAYSGTKACLTAWSKALRVELRAELVTQHVDILTVLIGTTPEWAN